MRPECVLRITEEPDEGKLHVRICGERLHETHLCTFKVKDLYGAETTLNNECYVD